MVCNVGVDIKEIKVDPTKPLFKSRKNNVEFPKKSSIIALVEIQ